MDEWRLAADRHGILRTGDFRRAGLGPDDIARLVTEHEITALHRGWYAVGLPGSPEERHVLATRALLRGYGGKAIAGHHSGLLILEVPTYRADLSRVRLSRRTLGPSRTRRAYSLGRTVPVEAQFAETVHPAFCVVQHGLSSGPMSALVAADAAVHMELITPTDLQAAVDWATFHPRSAAVKDFLALTDGRHESPGETRLAHALHLMQIAATPQFVVTTAGFSARVDFKVDGENVILEFDGQVKYGRDSDEPDPFGNRRSPQQVLWAEKRREDRLRELGFEVVRVTWDDLEDLVGVARRIRSAIYKARARQVGTLPA